jgi:hypothetical protein
MLSPCALADFSPLSQRDLEWAFEKLQAGDEIGARVIKGARKAKIAQRRDLAESTPEWRAFAASWVAQLARDLDRVNAREAA